MSSVLEQCLDAVVSIDQKNRIIFFNKAAERLWGYSAKEVLGENVKILVPASVKDHHDAHIERNRQGGSDRIVGTSRDVCMERKDGSQVWVNLALNKVVSGRSITYTAFVRDITAERASREMINQTLEQALDAVVTIDENNVIIFVNSAAEHLWGYDRQEMLGNNVKMLVPHDIQGRHDEMVNANRRTGVDKIVGTSREVPVFRKDGTRRWATLALSKIQLDDRILYTAFLKDVTEEVERRNEFRMLSMVANETDNAVIITTPDRKIVYVNRGFTQLTGYSLDEVVGKNPGDFLQGPHTDPETIDQIRQKASGRRRKGQGASVSLCDRGAANAKRAPLLLGARLLVSEPDQLSRKLRIFRERDGCFSLRSAFASIWRMRSRVTENCWPTSSSV